MFYQMIRKAGGDFMQRMTSLHELTLFAPSNEAWNHPYLDAVKKDPAALRNILDLHLVEKNLTIDSIIEHNKDSVCCWCFGAFHGWRFFFLSCFRCRPATVDIKFTSMSCNASTIGRCLWKVVAWMQPLSLRIFQRPTAKFTLLTGCLAYRTWRLLRSLRQIRCLSKD